MNLNLVKKNHETFLRRDFGWRRSKKENKNWWLFFFLGLQDSTESFSSILANMIC